MKQISMVIVPGPKPGIALLVHFYILFQNFICKFGCISSYAYGKGVDRFKVPSK